MISGIHKAFINNLPTVKWMDSTTAANAIEKVLYYSLIYIMVLVSKLTAVDIS